MEAYRKLLHPEELSALARSRSLKPQTFTAWGLGYDPVSKNYMIPMDGGNKRACKDIHRFNLSKSYGTKGGQVTLFSPRNVTDSQTVWLAEGPWDGMALWEALRSSGNKDDIYATAGASSFPKECAGMFSGKNVILLGQYDPINKHSGKRAGYVGMQRTGNLLSGLAESTRYLNWTGVPDENSKFDIRDLWKLIKYNPQELLAYINKNLQNRPPSDVGASTVRVAKLVGASLDRASAIVEYRKWLHIQNPEVLDVLFGSVFANRIDVDPLWIFFVSPPGGGKTELLMSLSEGQKMTSATTLTAPALISGANFGGTDPSLIPKLNGKTLIIKDFTTILNLTQVVRDEIFGILRDAYDGKTEKHFGNGVHRTYKSRFGVIAGVTPAIESLSASSTVLGERFIKYRLRAPGSINVGGEAIKVALETMLAESTMRASLKSVAKRILSRNVDSSKTPRPTKADIEFLRALSQFVAVLRGAVAHDRYSKEVMYKPAPEVGTRLAKQFCALAMGIAIYKREGSISGETLATVVKVAKDTAPDRAEDIVRNVYEHGNEPILATQIAEWTKLPSGTITTLLEDMCLLRCMVKVPEGRQILYRLNHSVVALIKKARIYENR